MRDMNPYLNGDVHSQVHLLAADGSPAVAGALLPRLHFPAPP